MKILIDNGHGVDTAGKRSPDGRVREWSYTRDIAEEVVKRLKAKGYDAERIVPEDRDISLGTRVARVNKWCEKLGKDNVVLVSIHLNAAGKGDWLNARGWSAWIYSESAGKRTKGLARCLHDAAQSEGLKIRHYRPRQAYWVSGFYIIKYTHCSAVLTENLFQDNKDDVKLLLSAEGREKIINLHVNGIIAWVALFGK